MLGWREGKGGGPSIGDGLWGWAPAGLLVTCGRVPAPWVLVCRAQLLAVPRRAPALLALGSPSISICLFLMQRSGLASALTPRWRRALLAPGSAVAGSRQSCSWENNSGGAPVCFPGCIFRCCWIKGCQGLAGDGGQCQAGGDPVHMGAGRSCSSATSRCRLFCQALGEVQAGLGTATVATGPGQSPVPLVAVNLSWLEMDGGGFISGYRLLFSKFPPKTSWVALTFLAESPGFSPVFPQQSVFQPTALPRSCK